MKNKSDATQNYARVSIAGDSLWIPMQRLETFLANNPYAELNDILTSDIVKKRFDVLTSADLEFLRDGSVLWSNAMRDCPFPLDYLRYWDAAILTRKETREG